MINVSMPLVTRSVVDRDARLRDRGLLLLTLRSCHLAIGTAAAEKFTKYVAFVSALPPSSSAIISTDGQRRHHHH